MRPAPRTRLDGTPSASRNLSVVSRPLDDLRTAAHRHGTTINDVLLAAVSGGMRALLVAHGEALDDLTLRVSIPVASPPGSRNAGGSMPIVTGLPLGDPDPVARLAAIHRDLVARKAQRDRTYRGVSESPLMPATVMRLLTRFMRRHGDRLVNLYVTNVPGPPGPLWLGTWKISHPAPIAPLVAGCRISIAALSYAGELDIAVHTDGSLEHVDELVGSIEATLDALIAASPVEGRSGPAATGTNDPEEDVVALQPPEESFGRARLTLWDRRTRERLATDVLNLGVGPRSLSSDFVTDADIEHLPEPAHRYLRWMGAVGRPRDHAFTARFVGQIRLRPDHAWMRFRAWQFNTTDPVTRLIRMRIDMAGVVPMFGTDTYIGGCGRMHGKALGLITVADGRGRAFDLGELVTYVNDAALLAPTMLLVPNCTWSPVDANSFDLAFTDCDNTVRARVDVDEVGRLVDFSTEDRWFAGTDPPSRTRWTTPVDGWTTRADGRRIPTAGSAVWHLPDGDFTYARGRFDPARLALRSSPDTGFDRT